MLLTMNCALAWEDDPAGELFSVQDLMARSKETFDTRCLQKLNDSCIGFHNDSTCAGDFTEIRCGNTLSRRSDDSSASHHEARLTCLTTSSFRLRHWQQLAKGAGTPNNGVYAPTLEACESRCATHKANGYYVEGWTFEIDNTCRCWIKPFGYPGLRASAFYGADSGFFKTSSLQPTWCGGYTVDQQKIWSGVVAMVTASNFNSCQSVCRNTYGTGISTYYKPGNNCFCLNDDWSYDFPNMWWDVNWMSGFAW